MNSNNIINRPTTGIPIPAVSEEDISAYSEKLTKIGFDPTDMNVLSQVLATAEKTFVQSPPTQATEETSPSEQDSLPNAYQEEGDGREKIKIALVEIRGALDQAQNQRGLRDRITLAIVNFFGIFFNRARDYARNLFVAQTATQRIKFLEALNQNIEILNSIESDDAREMRHRLLCGLGRVLGLNDNDSQPEMPTNSEVSGQVSTQVANQYEKDGHDLDIITDAMAKYRLDDKVCKNLLVECFNALCNTAQPKDDTEEVSENTTLNPLPSNQETTNEEQQAPQANAELAVQPNIPEETIPETTNDAHKAQEKVTENKEPESEETDKNPLAIDQIPQTETTVSEQKVENEDPEPVVNQSVEMSPEQQAVNAEGNEDPKPAVDQKVEKNEEEKTEEKVPAAENQPMVPQEIPEENKPEVPANGETPKNSEEVKE